MGLVVFDGETADGESMQCSAIMSWISCFRSSISLI